MEQDLVLEARSLACERGGRLIFQGLNFSVKSGEALELRGPNGSGKSSLLRLIAGLKRPADGTLSLYPVIPSKAGTPNKGSTEVMGPGFRRSDETVGEQAHYIGHAEAIKTSLTVKQNLTFWSSFLGGEANLKALRLEQLADDDARLLSEGQRRRLALSRLVSVKRPLWLLDEPTVGLDQTALADLRREMEMHLASGGIIIAATHVGLGLKQARTLELGAMA